MTNAGDPPHDGKAGQGTSANPLGAAPPEDSARANVVRVDFKRAQRTAPADPTAPQKHAVFSRFIQKGKVMVTLDARRIGVTVPRQFAEEPQLNLDFSERFGIADFVYDERGVRASLSFNRQALFCDVPWGAVYALYSHVDNERLTWARSLPADILEQLPESSAEHLERVLEAQVERLLRAAREQNERSPLRPAVVELATPADAPAPPALPAAQPSPADGPPSVAHAEDASTDGPEPPPPPPPPAGGRPGLRLVKG